MTNQTPILPLFILVDNLEQMGKPLIQFTSDDYNKELGSALIDAKNDAEAISSFLLELDESRAVLAGLDTYTTKDDTSKFQVIRACYIILLLFYTGLRIAEAAQHTMGNFSQHENNWFLPVIGHVTSLPDELLEALSAFRSSVSLPSSQPKFREKIPLIPMQNLKQSITPRRIDQILKWAFNLGAAKFEVVAPRKASKLRLASAHWLRHSYVTYFLQSGAPLKVAQENAGHSDIGTTMPYNHIAQTDRHVATRGLTIESKKE